jgi:uncharacterized protein YbjQ (UPF0145 family)
MLFSTTPTLEGHTIGHYHGLVAFEAIIGANILRDFMASITDVIGGRSGSYESALAAARDHALEGLGEKARALGANAVVGMRLDYEIFGEKGMMMVIAYGTAVTVA